MSRPDGHIRQRSAGSWELRYSGGINPATGKRKVYTATFRGESVADAKKELRRLLRTQDIGEHVDPTRLTVGDYLTSWLAAVRQEISLKTHERYAELVRHFLIPVLGKVPLGKLAVAHVQNLYSALADGGRRDGKPGGLAPRTRRQIHAILRSALGRAVEDGVLARNPCEVFKKKRLPKIEKKELTTLTAEQSAQLLKSLAHTRVYWPTLLALATGMRRGEILALRWRNVGAGTVRVMESLEQTKAGLRFKTTKTEKARAITLPAYANDELNRLKREQAESLLMLGVRQDGDTLVCARADGKPLQPRSLTHEFTVLLAGIKDVPRVRFHDLRHTHATQLLLAGVHPKIAQERLGHSTIATTMDIYSHVSDTMQEEAAAKLDEVFRMATASSRVR